MNKHLYLELVAFVLPSHDDKSRYIMLTGMHDNHISKTLAASVLYHKKDFSPLSF